MGFSRQVSPRFWVVQQPCELPPDCHCFHCPEIKYSPWYDDFGPMNAASIIQFVKMLDDKFTLNPSKQIVYVAEPDKRGLTNAVFLAGCYYILKYHEDPNKIWKLFKFLEPTEMEGYRDSSRGRADFRLSALDCWKGLAKGMSCGWIGLPDKHDVWGMIDPVEYSHYDNPLNANMHIVVPGRFVALQGPKDLEGTKLFVDNLITGQRTFSPSYYLDIFKDLNVKAVVRLNEPQYDLRIFESAGIRHFELQVEDCTNPSPDVVRRFCRIVDNCGGKAAVHCKAGLGRTGTLIALYLMRSHGFFAREAMGWLRIMRPGSVVGEQQHYLCRVERAVHSALVLCERVGSSASSASDATEEDLKKLREARPRLRDLALLS